MDSTRTPPEDPALEESIRGLFEGRPTAEELAALGRLRVEVLGMVDEPLLVGRYALLERVGGGGGGVVYRAHDRTLDREVALKLIGPDGAAHDADAQLATAVEEARALALVRHLNVIDVFDVGLLEDDSHEPRAYIVTEFVHGVTVGQWLTHPQARERILDVFEQAARGLAALHGGGLVHGDFKLDNLLLGVDDVVRVCDFGLATGIEAALASRTPGGTPGYRAPELDRGEPATCASDQFAFFVALHRGLLRRAPRRERGRFVVDLGQGAHALPRTVVAMLHRGLSEDPRDRFASMEEVIDGLRLLRGGRPRRRTLALAGVGVLVSVGAWLTTGLVSSPVAPCRELPSDTAPRPMQPRPLPAVGEPLHDDAFPATLVRTATVPPDPSRRKTESGTLSWSPDERWFLRRGTAPGQVVLHDGATYEAIDTLDVGTPRWSLDHPGVLYEIDLQDGTVYTIDVETRVQDVAIELGPCREGWEVSEALSWKDDRLGVSCGEQGSFLSLSDGTRSEEVPLPHAPRPSPSGALFVVNDEVRNEELALLHYLDFAAPENATFTTDAAARDLYVAVGFDPGPRGSGVGSVVSYPLGDATQTRVVVGPVTGWPYPKSGTRLDAAGPTAPGWVAVRSTGAPEGARVLEQELMLVDLTEGTHCRVAHHRSATNWQLALSPSGTRILFETDWGDPRGPLHTFVAETPAYASLRERG